MTTDLLLAVAPAHRSPTEAVPRPAPADAAHGATDGLIIVSSPHHQVETTAPVAALDLYDGGCVPLLRQRIGASPAHRARVLFLSGRHGLIDADTPLLPYRTPMSTDRARNHRHASASRLLPQLRTACGDRSTAAARPRTPGGAAADDPPGRQRPPLHRSARPLDRRRRGPRPLGVAVSTRILRHERLWRLTPDAWNAAVSVGIARSGIPAARHIAAAMGLPLYSVVARHNHAGTVHEHATGLVAVEADVGGLAQIPAGRRLLLVDDICASGAMLHAVADRLHARCAPTSVRTAVLCRNTGADLVPDTVVCDGLTHWVLFPATKSPTGQRGSLPNETAQARTPATRAAPIRRPLDAKEKLMNVSSPPMPAGTFTIGKRFVFEAGHRLTGLPPGHKCAQQHGHGYEVEVILTAPALEEPGFVTDFGALAPFKVFLDNELDHTNLTRDALGFEPTSELLAQYLAGWFVANVEPGIQGRLMAICVRETDRSWARFELAAR